MEGSSRAAYTLLPTSEHVELSEKTSKFKGHSRTNSSQLIQGQAWQRRNSRTDSSQYVESTMGYGSLEWSIGAFMTEGYLKSKEYLGDLLSARWKDFLVSLLPSFAQPSAPSHAAPRKVHKTAWLDGLRGVASFMVMFHHSSWLWYPHLSRGWGSCSDCYYIVQLPIIRVFYMGSAMVAIFFVISGFSLSHRALGLIRSGMFPELLDSLSSSTFRRGMRLILPTVVVTFFMMLATYFGFYATGPGNRQPPRYEKFSQNLYHWYLTVLDISDIFRPMNYPGWYNPPYDTNLWTIDVEFHGSLVIFLTLLGLSKVQANFRLLVLIAIPLWLLYYVHTHLFLFMAGVFLAELHHIREDRLQSVNSQNLDPSSPIPSQPRFLETLIPQLYWPKVRMSFWIINFLIALHVLSMPLLHEGAESSPGFRALVYYIPTSFRRPYVEDHFWIFLAAVHLIWCIDNAPFLQAIFTTKIATYLGKISFGLYLIHGTFLYTIGYNLSRNIHDYVGRETTLQYTGGVILTALVMYPLLFWCADVVYRHVDARSVAVAKWCHQKVSVGAK
ncbi:hypothetical protein EG329_006746 [Mollisiaceae sp. DMI_Dod_QoI]|nr:hypothetical protein EG329_006746 [Helotiales sp. DMI_Dod_QoI]